ncbi:hypothetical protein [Pseudoduganella namucuonensis]|uniref:Uncharacterized protein n=1 Tax=Pseudoduganella namucuonensis TaxID=1035707 RepID=A0A1I7IGE0_9BURK|nr:hypothetical protein [Pseudoduganella namucuonensis]SFU71972.1 hypothetical protein SAMN05216552_100819 [Pseudoduganella namucuonensis]
MKKLLAFAIILLLAIAAFDAIDPSDMIVHIGDEEFDGPLGALLGLVFGGVGMLIAAIALTCAAVFVGFLFAGLGILMVVGLALLALVLAAVVAPFMLPLLIPAAIVWFFVARNRRHREQETRHLKEQAV